MLKIDTFLFGKEELLLFRVETPLFGGYIISQPLFPFANSILEFREMKKKYLYILHAYDIVRLSKSIVTKRGDHHEQRRIIWKRNSDYEGYLGKWGRNLRH